MKPLRLKDTKIHKDLVLLGVSVPLWFKNFEKGYVAGVGNSNQQSLRRTLVLLILYAAFIARKENKGAKPQRIKV